MRAASPAAAGRSHRTAISGLPTPHPIGEWLPAIYLEDDFTQRLTAALDEVLAPVFLVLDSFPAYLDPMLAPEDFLAFLARWVAFAPDESWSEQRRRELVAQAVELHRWRGTKRGLTAHLRLLTGGEVEVLDSGVCAWTERSGGPVPGNGPAQVVVRVRVPAPESVELAALRSAVAELVPAHVRVTVEVLPIERAVSDDHL